MLKPFIFILFLSFSANANDMCTNIFATHNAYIRLSKSGIINAFSRLAYNSRGVAILNKIKQDFVSSKYTDYKIDTYAIVVPNGRRTPLQINAIIQYKSRKSHPGDWHLATVKIAGSRGKRDIPFLKSHDLNWGIGFFDRKPPDWANYTLSSDLKKTHFSRYYAFVTDNGRKMFLVLDVGPELHTASNLLYLYVTEL